MSSASKKTHQNQPKQKESTELHQLTQKDVQQTFIEDSQMLHKGLWNLQETD